MSKKQAIIDTILSQGMLPLFFYSDAEISLEITRTLYRAGVRLLEYTNRGEEALDNFIELKKAQAKDFPDLYLGVGTVKSLADAEAFIAAGADFIVSPIINPEVGELAHRHDMLWIPGCMTPTEIYTAQQHKAAIIKIFPANILGPAFVSSIKELFPGQLFIPTGGVDLSRENIAAWFKAGVCAVGTGSKLISKDTLQNHLYDQLYNDTKHVLETIRACK